MGAFFFLDSYKIHIMYPGQLYTSKCPRHRPVVLLTAKVITIYYREGVEYFQQLFVGDHHLSFIALLFSTHTASQILQLFLKILSSIHASKQRAQHFCLHFHIFLFNYPLLVLPLLNHRHKRHFN